MSEKFVHVGFKNFVAIDKVIAIATPKAAPTKRMVLEGRAAERVIDLSNGRRTKAVLVTVSGHIVLSSLEPDTIVSRSHEG